MCLFIQLGVLVAFMCFMGVLHFNCRPASGMGVHILFLDTLESAKIYVRISWLWILGEMNAHILL